MRIFYLLTAVCLVFSATALAETVTPTVASLNLRPDASTLNTAIGSTKSGDELEVIEKNEDGSWLNVKAEDGQVGWVSAKYVKQVDAEEYISEGEDITEPSTDEEMVEEESSDYEE